MIEPSVHELFTGNIITWKEMANRYQDDEILIRADDVYEYSKPFSERGKNSDRRLTGLELLSAYQEGNQWWVGRGGGGLNGDLFNNDILSGRWKTQIYEVNTTSDNPPSRNYFSLKDFIEALEST